jgi:hypothetical protein
MEKKPANWIPRDGLLAQAVQHSFEQGHSQSEIAREFRLNRRTVSRILGAERNAKTGEQKSSACAVGSELATKQEFACTSLKTADGKQMFEPYSKGLKQGEIEPREDASIDTSNRRFPRALKKDVGTAEDASDFESESLHSHKFEKQTSFIPAPPRIFRRGRPARRWHPPRSF